MIFDTSKLTALQRDHFQRVLDSYDYDWDAMLPQLKKRSAFYGKTRTQIPVIVLDIPAKYGAAGLSWPDGQGLWIDDQVAPDAIGPESWLWFMQIVMHELAHQAQFFGLSRADESQAARILGWDYLDGCRFAEPFALAFSEFDVGHSDIPPTTIQKIRKLMGGRGPVPAKLEMVA